MRPALPVVSLLAVATLSACTAAVPGSGEAGPFAIAGVERFDNEPSHTEADVDYPQDPPVGGRHDPVWQNCGVYDTPIRNENAVHSMEHGVVWVTYRPDLAAAEVDRLATLVGDQQFVLLSPYPGLDAPVVASAWNVQVTLEGADDPRLPRFVDAFVKGPTTPEPAGPCTGGTSETATTA